MKPKIVSNLCALAGFAGLLMTVPSLRAQDYRLYVDNSTDKTVSVIDLNSLKVINNINIGADLIHGEELLEQRGDADQNILNPGAIHGP